jgi:hypothetical protein
MFETQGMDDHDLGAYLREKFAEQDSADNNVIQFTPPNNKLH